MMSSRLDQTVCANGLHKPDQNKVEARVSIAVEFFIEIDVVFIS